MRKIFDDNLGVREKHAAVKILWNLALWSHGPKPIGEDSEINGEPADSVRFVQHNPKTDELLIEYHAPAGGVTKVRKTVQEANNLD